MPKTKLNEDELIGAITIAVIILIGFWYWNCSDGIRSVKKMYAYQIISETAQKEEGGIKDPEEFHKKAGYNTSISFLDAIESTNPSKIKFSTTKTNVKHIGNDPVKGVEVLVEYDKPWKGADAIRMIFGVEKEHFWHFNPVVLRPDTITVYSNNSMKEETYDYWKNPIQVSEILKAYFKNDKK